MTPVDDTQVDGEGDEQAVVNGSVVPGGQVDCFGDQRLGLDDMDGAADDLAEKRRDFVGRQQPAVKQFPQRLSDFGQPEIEYDQPAAGQSGIVGDLLGEGGVRFRDDPLPATQLSTTTSDVTHPVLGDEGRAFGEVPLGLEPGWCFPELGQPGQDVLRRTGCTSIVTRWFSGRSTGRIGLNTPPW